MGTKTIEELKTKITNELKKYSEELSFAIMKNQIIKNIVSSYNFDLPPTLVAKRRGNNKKKQLNSQKKMTMKKKRN